MQSYYIVNNENHANNYNIDATFSISDDCNDIDLDSSLDFDIDEDIRLCTPSPFNNYKYIYNIVHDYVIDAVGDNLLSEYMAIYRDKIGVVEYFAEFAAAIDNVSILSTLVQQGIKLEDTKCLSIAIENASYNAVCMILDYYVKTNYYNGLESIAVLDLINHINPMTGTKYIYFNRKRRSEESDMNMTFILDEIFKYDKICRSYIFDKFSMAINNIIDCVSFNTDAFKYKSIICKRRCICEYLSRSNIIDL